MMSAGLIGTPGLGYAKDRFTAEELKGKDQAVFEEYKAKEPSTFLGLKSTEIVGIDGTLLEEAQGSRSPERGAAVGGRCRPGRCPSNSEGRCLHPSGDGPDLPGPDGLLQIDWRLQAGAHRRAREPHHRRCGGDGRVVKSASNHFQRPRSSRDGAVFVRAEGPASS